METMITQLGARVTQLEEMVDLSPAASNVPIATMITANASQIDQINRELERTKAIAEKAITDNAKSQGDINEQFATASRELDNRYQYRRYPTLSLTSTPPWRKRVKNLSRRRPTRRIDSPPGRTAFQAISPKWRRRCWITIQKLNKDVEEKVEKLKAAGVELKKSEEEMMRIIKDKVAFSGAKRDMDKPITEFKVIVGLPKLADERKEFRNWKEKLKSALTQAKEEYEELVDFADSYWQ